MSSSPGSQIAVALYRRDPISTDPRKRQIYKHESYHWGILIGEGAVFDAYDATDRNDIDPVTFRQRNPTNEWFFNASPGVKPAKSGRFLGHVIIGAVPSSMSRDDVKALLESIPLPKRNQNPQESCVTWVANAIRAFHQAQCVADFNVEKFLDWALSFADQRLASPDKTAPSVSYQGD